MPPEVFKDCFGMVQQLGGKKVEERPDGGFIIFDDSQALLACEDRLFVVKAVCGNLGR